MRDMRKQPAYVATHAGVSAKRRNIGSEAGQPLSVDSFEIDPADAWAAIRAVVGDGGSIQFRFTRDRTALLVQIWEAGQTYDKYVASAEALADYLVQIRREFN